MADPTVKAVNLAWSKELETLPTNYANTLYISHAGGEFILVFGETIVPYPMTKDMDTLNVRPVVRLAISVEGMFDVYRLIQTNMEIFQKSKRGQAMIALINEERGIIEGKQEESNDNPSE